MSINNTYKIVIPPGCGYPMYVPVDPKKLKPRWLPYGRRVTPIVLCGGKSDSEYYFTKRYATPRAKNEDHRYDQQTGSYPRIITSLTKDHD